MTAIWWNKLPKAERPAFVVGFFEGVRFGGSIAIWGFQENNDAPATKEQVASALSFRRMQLKYLEGVTGTQLEDGLTEFYRDYRNRLIPIHGAAWLVLNEIKGTPRKQLDEMIESWRREAGK